MSVAFYCVTSHDFFPGAVALVNSLRLVGHGEPIHVLDCGLRPEERDLLAVEASVLDAPREAPPSALKLAGPLARPAATAVLLDADVIVTHRLDEPLALAAEGRLVAFRNERERHFAAWGQLAAGRPPRPGPYLSSAAVFAGGNAARTLLPRWAGALTELDPSRTWLAGGREEDPFFYADQDVLNALAHSLLGPEEVRALDPRLVAIPPFEGLRVVDAGGLRCAYRDGSEPLLVHHLGRKPWLVPLRSNPYSRLLTRLLLGDDVALRLDERRLPRRLRRGASAAVARVAADLGYGIPRSLARRLRRGRRVTPAWPPRPAPPG